MLYVNYDLEATCDENNRNHDYETIEIGAVLYKDNKKISQFDVYITPIHTKINDFCTELTGISNKMIEDIQAPLYPEALKIFKGWIDRNNIENENITYLSWGFYDFVQIKKDCLRHKIKSNFIKEKNHYSLKHLFPIFYKNFKDGKHVKSRGVGMKIVLNELNIEFEGRPHNGLDDAINMGKIFEKEYENFVFCIDMLNKKKEMTDVLSYWRYSRNALNREIKF